MVEQLESEDFGLGEEVFKDGVESFLAGQVQLMRQYGIGLYDPAFRQDLDRQIEDLYLAPSGQ